MTSPYLDRPLLPLAVALPRMPKTVTAFSSMALASAAVPTWPRPSEPLLTRHPPPFDADARSPLCSAFAALEPAADKNDDVEVSLRGVLRVFGRAVQTCNKYVLNLLARSRGCRMTRRSSGNMVKIPFWHPLQHCPAGITGPKVAEMLDLASRARAQQRKNSVPEPPFRREVRAWPD